MIERATNEDRKKNYSRAFDVGSSKFPKKKSFLALSHWNRAFSLRDQARIDVREEEKSFAAKMQ